MSEIGNHTNVLNSFVQLFVTDHGLGVTSPHIGGLERDEIVDDNSSDDAVSKEGVGRAMKSNLTKLFELVKARSSIRMDANQAACIEAVIDSVYENRGLFDISYEQVAAEYLPIFGELKIAELNRARVFLMHQGPVLGLAARSTREFKWVLSRHFVACDFNRDNALQNRQLTSCFNHLIKGGKTMMPMFMSLCGIIHKECKAPRRLTPGKAQRLIKCNKTEAALLCEVYKLLPDSPLV